MNCFIIPCPVQLGNYIKAANSTIDNFLGTELVPHTQLLTCKLLSSPESITGSFQLYVDNAPDLYSQLEGDDLFETNLEALAISLDTPTNRELEFRNFEKFAFFDLLTGNNDHHFKNILLKSVGRKVWDFVAIDNANSLPWCHDLDLPSYKMHPLHWFKWSALPQAQKPFSDSMINKINELDIRHLERNLRKDLIHKDVPSSEEHLEGKIKTLHDRFNQIKELANQKVLISMIAKSILALIDRN